MNIVKASEPQKTKKLEQGGSSCWLERRETGGG
jgi:hypothetical protein